MRFDCVSLKKKKQFISRLLWHKHNQIHQIFINSQTRSTRCDLNEETSFSKGQILHPTGRNIKAVSSKAPPEIKAPCILFASVRETKYSSNISKPVGNLYKTNLRNDLITATEWNHLVWKLSGTAAVGSSFQWLTTSDGGGGNRQRTNFLQVHQSNVFRKPTYESETSGF